MNAVLGRTGIIGLNQDGWDGLNQDEKDKRMDQDLDLNQDGWDGRMDRDHGI